ncbi:hypothetical protein G3R49_19655 [Shewanella sp. WXL01]|uniref:hypothetical protein n=1 Tax=Shewanella sp. WXL01 TaxID=2709721 RepID=UPI0014385099|nr:hypothetical protein [Shewanella sp. WXL01]NKF52776.1 hypothetical protein [Shewanella sp. WXL01]
MNPSQLLDLLKAATGLTTDYQIHKKLGFSQTGVSNWRTDRSYPKNDVLIKFAEILDMNAGVLMLYSLARREKNEKAKAELNLLLDAIANAKFDDSFIAKDEKEAFELEKISSAPAKYSLENHTLNMMW